MQIQELSTFSPKAFTEIIPLMKQLNESIEFTEEKLKATIEDSGCHLYCMYDGETIIGCATLCIYHSPTGTKASVEDVVVSEDYRGQHLGKQLMEHVLEQARQLTPITIHLTSNPKRTAANKLYQSLGFEKKETNCYVKTIALKSYHPNPSKHYTISSPNLTRNDKTPTPTPHACAGRHPLR